MSTDPRTLQSITGEEMTDQEVSEITKKISFLIEETGRQQDNRSLCRDAHIECHELGQLLAQGFGRRRNWKLSPGRFTISALRDRRAAAVVGHLYEPLPEGIETWAQANGLKASFLEDFPSWYYPGWTKLVLIEKRATP